MLCLNDLCLLPLSVILLLVDKVGEDVKGNLFKVKVDNCAMITVTTTMKKLPEKLWRYAPTKGNQEETDRIIDIIDIIDIINIIDIIDIVDLIDIMDLIDR